MATFFIPINKIKQESYLDKNVNDRDIVIALKEAQVMILEPAIGAKLYQKIETLIETNQLNNDPDYLFLMKEKIWDVLINATIFRLSINLLFRYTNSGIMKDNNPSSTSIDYIDLNKLREDREGVMDKYLNKLKNYLILNQNKFPEFLQVDQAEGGPFAQYNDNNLNFYYPGIDLDFAANYTYRPEDTQNY